MAIRCAGIAQHILLVTDPDRGGSGLTGSARPGERAANHPPASESLIASRGAGAGRPSPAAAPASDEGQRSSGGVANRGWVWRFLALGAGIILLAGAVASKMGMIGNPWTVVQTTSDAIIVQPSGIIDLVTLARPRFGLYDSLRVFDGISLDPHMHTDTLLQTFGPEPVDTPGNVLVIQRLEVTPQCQVSIEQMGDRLIRVDIRSIRSDSAGAPENSCWASAEMMAERTSDADTVRVSRETRVFPGQPMTLQFRPRDPLRLRRFAVSGLGFTTSESGSPESAIRGGFVYLPDYGNSRDTLYSGDRLTLGELQGELAELHFGRDGIRALFKGTASDPMIGARDLEPSILQQSFYADDLKIVVAIIVAFASVTMAIFQVVLRS